MKLWSLDQEDIVDSWHLSGSNLVCMLMGLIFVHWGALYMGVINAIKEVLSKWVIVSSIQCPLTFITDWTDSKKMSTMSRMVRIQLGRMEFSNTPTLTPTCMQLGRSKTHAGQIPQIMGWWPFNPSHAQHTRQECQRVCNVD